MGVVGMLSLKCSPPLNSPQSIKTRHHPILTTSFSRLSPIQFTYPHKNPNKICFSSLIHQCAKTQSRHLSILSKTEYNGDKDDDDDDDDAQNVSVGVKAALSMLHFYKREISPLLPKSCRYVPTCSEYSMIAYKKYGVAKGTVLTAWRLCRCNPLGGSGFDPPRWFGEERASEE